MTESLEIDSPEVHNWVQEKLDDSGVPIFFVEGYSVNGQSVTGLFERRISTKPLRHWTLEEIAGSLKNEGGSWAARSQLARILKVPLYFVIYQKTIERFLVTEVTESQGRLSVSNPNEFDTCRALAKWLGTLKGIPVSKGFEEHARLSIIDNCLRREGVPWPGNLDGFVLDSQGRSVVAIIEYSRTRKRPVREHDIIQYYHKDINRWKPLEIFQKQARCEMYVIFWSSTESVIKLLKVKTLSPSLSWESQEIVTAVDLVSKMKRVFHI